MEDTQQLDLNNVALSKKDTFVSYDPFCCFSIDGFLPDDIYEYCAANFPVADYDVHRNKSKYYFDNLNDEEVFEKFCLEHPVWGQVLKHFQSQEFVKDTIEFLSKGIKQSRNDDWDQHPITVLTQFSHMLSGDEIFPHTDHHRKLLSMLVYFPEPDWKAEYGGGTGFYKLKDSADPADWPLWRSEDPYPNLENQKFRSEKDYEMFYRDMDCFFSAEYKPNLMAGFVKSHDSYHAVPELKCPEGMHRNCLNIQFEIDDDSKEDDDY